jgi:hypothetical protein
VRGATSLNEFNAKEHTMKIQIVKKGNAKVKAIGQCPMFVDIPPEAGKKN